MNAYPLTWPPGVPRLTKRETGQFKTSLAGALKNVQDSLRRFGSDSRMPVENIILSSNVSLGVEKPADPGVAVWFMWDGAQVCIPVDRYTTPAANLQAIYHVIEARRVELRHGTLALVRATFQGFKALPAPNVVAWHVVLELNTRHPTSEELKTAYRRMAAKTHPDKGGSSEKMAEVNDAYLRARAELGYE